jgi:hypothetical protein
METSLRAMSGYQSRHLTLHHSLFQAASIRGAGGLSSKGRDSFTELASHTCLLQQALVLTFEPSVRKIRTHICSLIRRQLFLFQNIYMSNHCRQLPLVRGLTNKISWLNLPFMLLMSAAGILVGLFSCLR